MTVSTRTRMLALIASLAMAPAPAFAQEPPPAEGAPSEGRPLDGYFATGVLAAMAIFAVAKTARR